MESDDQIPNDKEQEKACASRKEAKSAKKNVA
jgi:hypothetical protein